MTLRRHCWRGLCAAGGGLYFCEHVHDSESRVRAIRAVVAAQWSVACTLFGAPWSTPPGEEPGSLHPDGVSWQDYAAEDLAALPCAVDIVGDL